MFAPIILSGLLMAGMIRYATEDSGKTTSSSNPTQTPSVREKDNSAAMAARETAGSQGFSNSGYEASST